MWLSGLSIATCALALVTILCPEAQAQAQAGTFCADAKDARPPAALAPIDEAINDPEFFTYRARLQAAIAMRDVDAVIAMTDPNVKLGFGGDDGAERLRQNLIGANAPRLWAGMARILALGGAFEGGMFQAPYYFARWPEGADSLECGVIVGRNVNLRREPAADAPVVASSSYDLVRRMVPGVSNVPEGWSAVELRNGRRAFVRNEYFGAPVGLRALFNRVNGQWRLTALVSGD